MYGDDKNLRLKIARENLRSLDISLPSDCEKRVAHIADLAFEMYPDLARDSNGGLCLPDDFFLVSETEFEEENHAADILSENMSAFLHYQKAMRRFDKACFAQVTYELETERNSARLTSTFPSEDKGEATRRLCYVKNVYADEAYTRLSSIVKKSSVIYAENFREACKSVAEGECGFCLLPIGNFGDGRKGGRLYGREYSRIKGVYELIEHYRLKICAVSDIPHTDDETSVRFAVLAAKQYRSVPSNQKDRYIEFTIYSEGDEKAHELLFAAQMYGLSITSLEASEDEPSGRRKTFFTFHGKMDAAEKLQLYLGLFMFANTPIGIYPEIKSED